MSTTTDPTTPPQVASAEPSRRGRWHPGAGRLDRLCLWPRPGQGRRRARAQCGALERSRRRTVAVAWQACVVWACCASMAWASSSASPLPGCQLRAASVSPPGSIASASARSCAEPLRLWAVHRSSLRRLVRWPACQADAAPGTCGRPRCAPIAGAGSSDCAKARPLASGMAVDRPLVGADAEIKASTPPRR